MVTKAISGSPLKRVLNRSLTWKETVGMAAPESVAIEKQYADALKAFESIPDFPDEWADEQKRFATLSQTMRDLETDLITADEAVRKPHAKRIVDATDAAKKLAEDVGGKLKENRDGTIKALTGTCVELRGLLLRLGKGMPEIQPDLDYARQLAPAMKEFAGIVARYKLLTGRFVKIEEYMSKLGQYLPETIEKLLVQADVAARKFETSAGGAGTLRDKLLGEVKKAPAPPARKTFSNLYGDDAAAMEKARLGFQKWIDDLSDEEQRIIKGLNESIALFSGGEFKQLNHWIHMIARYDARREIAEQDARKGSKGSTAKAQVATPDEPPVPTLPPRPTDESSGRTIKILNRGLAPVSVLTGSEQGKVDDFLALHDQVVPSRLRDLMNERFGSFEFVNHSTVRLSRRRRLEFDIDMASAATEARLTLRNIGDPTYEH